MFQTEHEFSLPLGYADEQGDLHRDGVMRLATAADEILPLKDPRVQANQAYLVIVLLSRVITKLGSIPQLTPKVIEGLYAADLSYLQEFYNQINRSGKATLATMCPQCSHTFEVEMNSEGGLQATPSKRCTRR